MEIKAQFDEENNLYWVERLQNEGVKVMNVLPDYKVHAKLVLVTTKENGKKYHYAAIGTGNPNEKTAFARGNNKVSLPKTLQIMERLNYIYS